ncbi:hypothetical protein SmJEL517_g01218 [Synchytrium microbalum]|uniref:2-oxoisovalerate dehydrogenase subunit alpha n=1 Tax=Synchytrium microbalum TaxID=1806994 RepID=A0A507C697_9FUNG|nr:uncharacterized protein SmJEL517_g01218 [Synchytrium microbalum]TPX36557.1 hypothetical protein SmJEL517_g01218 [Synchytrium microbalum]
MRACIKLRKSLNVTACLKLQQTLIRRTYAAASTSQTINQLPAYPGADIKYTPTLTSKSSYPTIETFRILNPEGEIEPGATDPNLSRETCLKIYQSMVLTEIMDSLLYESNRHGRIGFYMSSSGEEAVAVASAAALKKDDHIISSAREQGSLVYLGFELKRIVGQAFANEADLGKGRQMPVHYTSKDLHFHPVSSPMGSQPPHGAGVGYALKRSKKDACCICFFGDGAASQGDFHAAVNMAAVHGSRTIFLCRNNGFSISTRTTEQYIGDGVAARGIALGVETMRVDGNDPLAVYSVVSKARKLTVSENRPILVEAMTYRLSHHSTSDDSTVYRPQSEIDLFKQLSPILRFKKYIARVHGWTDSDESILQQTSRKRVMEALAEDDSLMRPEINDLFTDVYDTVPANLKEQRQELRDMFAVSPVLRQEAERHRGGSDAL